MSNRHGASDRPRQAVAHQHVRQPQGGQALAEGVAVLALLLVFFVSIGWLGRLHDIAMMAQHVSSLAAFTFARSVSPVSASGPGSRVDVLLSGEEGQRWLDLQGRSLVHGGLASPLVRVRSGHVPVHAQPGGASARARALRQDWGIRDHSVVTAVVSMPWRGPGGFIRPVLTGYAADEVVSSSVYAEPETGSSPAGQSFLHRHTVLVAGAGHADHDAEVGRRLGQSWLAWRRSAQTSARLAEKASRAMEPVDAAWHRPVVNTDWLGPWVGRVPRAFIAPAVSHASAH